MTDKLKPIEFNVYKTNVGVFFQENTHGYYKTSAATIKINGVQLSDITYVNYWYRIQSDIVSVQFKTSNEEKLVGFKLDNVKLSSENIPVYLDVKVVEPYYNDNEDEIVWTTFDDIRSLYSPVYETIEGTWVDREFKLNIIGEFQVSDYHDIVNMKVKSKEPNYRSGHDVHERELKDVVKYEQLDQLLVPQPLLHLRPCEISSEQVYKIVRQYILDNYDRKVCTIDINYDFCFSVKKQILCEPYSVEKYVSYGKRAKTKKVTENTKSVQVFEMTHSGYDPGISSNNRQPGGGYKGYTVIKPWKANNLLEMKEQIEDYLKRLIDFLNAPAVECKHCSGTGILDSLTKIER